MAFLVRVRAVERTKEYRGTSQNGEPYCIATWEVLNVADKTTMLVTCFTNDDDILQANPSLDIDGTLTITCKSWSSKDGRSGKMNNVNLTNLIAPEKVQDVPGQELRSNKMEGLPLEEGVNNSLNPFATNGVAGDLPF